MEVLNREIEKFKYFITDLRYSIYLEYLYTHKRIIYWKEAFVLSTKSNNLINKMFWCVCICIEICTVMPERWEDFFVWNWQCFQRKVADTNIVVQSSSDKSQEFVFGILSKFGLDDLWTRSSISWCLMNSCPVRHPPCDFCIGLWCAFRH